MFGAPRSSKNLTVVLVIGFYFTVSISLVLLNKLSFSSNKYGLDAPLFLTWSQLACAIFCCYVAASLNKTVRALSFFPSWEYDLDLAWRVAPLSAVFVGMIVCNNLCLKYVEVSFYQVARALTIVFNIAFSYLVLGQKTSQRAISMCGIVVLGYLIGCNGEVNFSVQGVVFGVSSSAFVCLYSIYVKKILPVLDDNHWRLMIYNNINSFILMPVFIVLAGEPAVISEAPQLAERVFWSVLLLTGFFGFLINIATFMQIKYTSPLTHNVSGTAKACVQTIIGVLIWQNEVSPAAGLGAVLSILGCGGYGVVRYLEGQEAKKKQTSSNASSPAGATPAAGARKPATYMRMDQRSSSDGLGKLVEQMASQDEEEMELVMRSVEDDGRRDGGK